MSTVFERHQLVNETLLMGKYPRAKKAENYNRNRMQSKQIIARKILRRVKRRPRTKVTQAKVRRSTCRRHIIPRTAKHIRELARKQLQQTNIEEDKWMTMECDTEIQPPTTATCKDRKRMSQSDLTGIDRCEKILDQVSTTNEIHFEQHTI